MLQLLKKTTSRDTDIATPSKLMWWKFKKHKLAVISLFGILFMYFIVLVCDFVAPSTAILESNRSNMPPHVVRFVKNGKWIGPYVCMVENQINPKTFKREYVENLDEIMKLGFFVKGTPYKFWTIWKMDTHFFGAKNPDHYMNLLGTDVLGRDLLSRIIIGSRLSLTIGLFGIAMTFIIGITLGAISGYFGGVLDMIIQRVIEFIQTLPTIPLWMGLSAALPRDMPSTQIAFLIGLILSLVGWTGLARVTRGKILSVREEEFVIAARAMGASEMRIIRKHLIPSFSSYIIVSLTLALPGMLLGESALSFIGLGLQPPAVSWGILLQDAQKIVAVAYRPWVLAPIVSLVLVTLMFNFLGDGLRDCSDPYSEVS